MKAILATCTPGQVKRIMSMMADLIPTNLPKKVADNLIEAQLRTAMEKLWKEANNELWKSLMKIFEPVLVLEMELEKDFSFEAYQEKPGGILIGSPWTTDHFADYPKAKIFGKKQAIVAKVKKTSSVEEFCLHVAMNKGYLPGREGVIQFFEKNSKKISELIPEFGWLIAPVQSREIYSSLKDISFGAFPALQKESGDEQKFVLVDNSQLLQPGQFVLFFADAVKK